MSKRNKSYAFAILDQFDHVLGNVGEILNSPIKEEWKRSMENEMESMRLSQVRESVNLPKGKKTIMNEKVYTIKESANEKPIQTKSCLIAKEFNQ